MQDGFQDDRYETDDDLLGNPTKADYVLLIIGVAILFSWIFYVF